MSSSPVKNVFTQVLLDGSKTFWKTRSYLKIVIVHHAVQAIVEVIAYDPADGVEFPRLYLDSQLIISKFDKNIIESTYASKIEVFIRQKIKKERNELIKEIQTNMLMQYAYARLNVTFDSESKNSFQLGLQPTFDDVMVDGEGNSMRIDTERLAPSDLIPYEVIKTIVKSKVDEFQTMFTDMTNDKAVIASELNKASRSMVLVSSALSGFVTAFRRQSQFNMRALIFSQAKQRWFKAIHKVVVRNFIAAVRIRLTRSPLFATTDLFTPSIGAVIAAKNKFLKIKKKKSFCDERVGLSSGSIGSFGVSNSKTGTHQHQPHRDPILAAIDAMRAASSVVEVTESESPVTVSVEPVVLPDITSPGSVKLESSPRVPLPAASRLKNGALRGSFDDSLLMENTASKVPAAVAPLSMTESEETFIQSKLLQKKYGFIRLTAIESAARPEPTKISCTYGGSDASPDALPSLRLIHSMSDQTMGVSASPSLLVRQTSSVGLLPTTATAETNGDSERALPVLPATTLSTPVPLHNRTTAAQEARHAENALLMRARNNSTPNIPPILRRNSGRSPDKASTTGSAGCLSPTDSRSSSPSFSTPQESPSNRKDTPRSSSFTRENSTKMNLLDPVDMTGVDTFSQSGGIAGQHANYTPGLKLLKRVGSFKHAEPLSRTPSSKRLLPPQMNGGSIASPSNNSTSPSSVTASLSPSRPSSGSHLSKMKSLRNLQIVTDL